MKKYNLEIIVFMSGLIGMGLELIAARILSPYVGSSNVVWTSIIGIILLSMSIGYYLGGLLSKKDITRNTISIILLVSSITTSLIILFETIIVKVLSRNINNTIIAAILCSLLVFSIPSLILAMISPCAVKIKSRETKNVGETSGKLSSISTIGSITGTFLMGFILIPNFGITNLVISITIALFLCSLLIRDEWNKQLIITNILILISIIILLLFGKYIFKRANPNIILDIDSEYSRIWITKTKEESLNMYVDNTIESYINLKDGTMAADYLYYYDLFEYYVKDANKTLMIGGAGYTYPMHYLNKYQDKTIDVVEIDPTMTKLAIEYFNLDTSNKRLNIYHKDGRSYLNNSKEKYDVILIDAFKGSNAPFELTTYEALTNAKNLLNKNGVVLTNIISSLTGPNSNFLKYEYATYKEVFDDVKVIRVFNTADTNYQNIILIGIKGHNLNSSVYLDYYKYLKNEIIYSSDKKIVTDDFAPIGT